MSLHFFLSCFARPEMEPEVPLIVLDPSDSDPLSPKSEPLSPESDPPSPGSDPSESDSSSESDCSSEDSFFDLTIRGTIFP